MSFTQTTKLEKAKLMAYLSAVSINNSYRAGYPTYPNPLHNNDVTALINAGKYINNTLLGTEPIAVTTGGSLTIDNDHPPQSLLYYFTGAPTSVTITSDLRTAFVLINNTYSEITYSINSSNKILASGQVLLVILKPFKSSIDTDYLILDGVIPYGWTAEDMSLKVNKGDEVRISTGDTMVQSAITEVNLPGYEQFSFFTNGKPSAIDNTYISHCPTIGLIPASLRYLLIVPVLPYNEFVDYDGVYAGVPIYQIDLLNGVTISQEWNANQPNKSTLSFKKDAGFNEEIAVPIYVE